MNHQQIVSFVDLASKYHQKKYNNINNCDWQPEDTFSTIGNMDLAVFRRTVQEKIKVKYQENRHLKTSPQTISKTLPFKPDDSSYSKIKRKIVIHTEESEKTTFPQPRQLLSHSQMHKHDSLQRFINKKQHSFLAKSNLFVGPSSTSFKERKCINSHIKTQNTIFKDIRKSNSISKKQDFAIKLRQQVTNFGYQMDGSIYHFQDNRSITVEQPNLNPSLRNKGSQRNKEQVYSMLRNTSPLNVQKKLVREKRTSETYQVKETDLVNRMQKVRQSFKFSNKKHKDELRQTALSKMLPSFSKQTNSFFLRSKEEDISGWQHDDQS